MQIRSSLNQPLVFFVMPLLALLFLALIVWASYEGYFFEEFAAIAEMPWGLVALADLYIGFFIFGCFIWVTESCKKRAACWIFILFMLGNLISLVYLVYALKRGFIFQKLSK